MRKVIFSIITVILFSATTYLTIPDIAHAEEATLYKAPSCGCCEEYGNYLRKNGFTVNVRPTSKVAAMSTEVGIPKDFQGCHLTYIGDYVISGHVPVEIVNKMLKERPDIKGITLPGMPLGSPGMGGTKRREFIVYEVSDASATQPRIYASE